MPLLNTDWTVDERDPLAFLAAWSATVAGALGGQLANHPQVAGEARFVLELVSTLRADRIGSGGSSSDTPTFVAPARFTDSIGVFVLDTPDGRNLAAAVLFVTPDNKSDSDASLAFAVRAAGLMSAGAGVVIVDALPGPASWATHLHSLTGVYPITKRPRGTDSPVLAVQPAVEDGAERFRVWHHAIPTGAPLPTVPLAIRGAMHLSLDLKATYAEACANSRIS